MIKTIIYFSKKSNWFNGFIIRVISVYLKEKRLSLVSIDNVLLDNHIRKELENYGEGLIDRLISRTRDNRPSEINLKKAREQSCKDELVKIKEIEDLKNK